VVGADDAGEAVAVLEELTARARARRVEAAVLEFIGDNPGATGNAVALAVQGDRALVFRKLRELDRAGVLRWAPGPKGARKWYLAKTSTGVSTADGCA
jgi:hypothetical protein